MRRILRGLFIQSRIAAIAVLGILVSTPAAHCQEGADAQAEGAASSTPTRTPFDPPRTKEELRWLLDRAEEKQFDQTNGPGRPEIGRWEANPLPPHVLGPELRRIQDAQGGPVIDQFPFLQPGAEDVTPLSSATVYAPALPAAPAVKALREAAAQLDAAANRLERLELYRQADALRQQAQRLRLDARALVQPIDPTGAATEAPPWRPADAPQNPPPGGRRFGLSTPPRATSVPPTRPEEPQIRPEPPADERAERNERLQ